MLNRIARDIILFLVILHWLLYLISLRHRIPTTICLAYIASVYRCLPSWLACQVITTKVADLNFTRVIGDTVVATDILRSASTANLVIALAFSLRKTLGESCFPCWLAAQAMRFSLIGYTCKTWNLTIKGWAWSVIMCNLRDWAVPEDEYDFKSWSSKLIKIHVELIWAHVTMPWEM